MEQANTQAPMSQEQLMMLTEMVQQLFREINREQEPEDPHVTTRIPVTDLTSYPALTEALPSIEEDFFRSPLTEEERKIAIHSCPKATDIAATVTQARLGNLHKGLDLPGKPTQLVESENKPLMDQEALETLIVKKPVAKRQRVQPFRKLQQKPLAASQIFAEEVAAAGGGLSRGSKRVPISGPSRYVQIGMVQTDGQPIGSDHSFEGIQNPLHEPKISDIESVIGKNEKSGVDAPCSRDEPYGPTANVSPASVQMESEPGGQRSSEEGSRIITDEAFHQGNPATGSSILQSAAHDPEEDWRPPTLPKVPPLSLEWPLLPIPRPVIRAITELFGLHQDPASSSRMGQIEKDSCLCISRRFANHGRIQRRVPNEHALNLFQAFAAWIQSQFRQVVDHPISVDHPLRNGNQLQGNDHQGSIQQDPGSATRGQQNTERWPDDPEEFGELHWESSINVGRCNSWKADATLTTRAQKPSSVNIEFMDIDSDSDETSNPEPVLLEESANVMERSLVLARDAGNVDFYRRQRLSLGNSSGPTLLLWHMEPQGSKTPYHHEGTVESAVCTEARECKQETRPLLKLVSGQQSTGTERSEPRMDQVQQSVLLPTLEPDNTGSPEGPPRESHNDTSGSNVEIRNLVPRPDSAIDFTATASPSNNSGPRPEKRKVAALGKQALELDSLEDQRSFLETQSLGTYAINFIVSNERRVRRRSRCSSIQQRFLDWRISNEVSTPISAPQVINYLAEIYTVEKFKVGSIKAYKSAILQLSDSPAELAAHSMFSEFIKSLDDNSIKSFIRPVMDISSVIKLLRE
ncbi:hypothetical protein AYI69_g6930 [Smittium culicis]|uniref:Uncharacterized protein n=1 Tax=Smittium culicis TaxID=133412 RepID=A0A1R1XVE5_9FUNG|nr:hypothetical protein AYI69_g6930 [Smittium culicis]